MSQRLSNLACIIQQKQYKDGSKLCPIELRRIVFGQGLKYINQIHKIIIQNKTIFNHADIQDQNRKQERYHAAKQMICILSNYKFSDLKKQGEKFAFGVYALTGYNLGLSIKSNIQYLLYLKTLITFGNQITHKQFISKALSLQHLGCFALTQLHHGSFTKGMMTQARFDKLNNNFILTTNGTKGMKFWIGASAQIANMAIIWAQLIVQGISHGPHPFVVQIRDFKNHNLLPGIIIGDCGSKIGLNNIDNGYFILEDVVVPRISLLDKLGSVDQNGKYVSKIKSNEQRFGLHMSPLSAGRANLAFCPLVSSSNALAIALRYVCQRRQFSDPKSKQKQQKLLIQYPLTKYRLIPQVAKQFVYMIGGYFITKKYLQNIQILTDSQNKLVSQLHAISAVLKAKSSWFTSNCITQCRQMLGGHGYSAFSRLGRIYTDNDVNLTWQGDNNMLLQQTSKFLLKVLQSKKGCQLTKIEFFSQNLQNKNIDLADLSSVETLQFYLKDLLIFKFKQVKTKIKNLKQQKTAYGQEWNLLQPYFANQFSLMFGDYIYLEQAKLKLNQITRQQQKNFLKKCITLWLLQVLQSYRFGNVQLRQKMQNKIIQLCNEMTIDSIKFINSIASPEQIIDSPFANTQSGMNEYINLIMTGKDTFKRVDWYQQLVNLRTNNQKLAGKK